MNPVQIRFSNSREGVNQRSRGVVRPSFVIQCPPVTEGGRECRVPAAPAASRAKLNKAHERSHHRFTGATRHSLRNGFNGLLRALPGERIRLVTVISGLRSCPRPVGPTCLRQLGTSNGCQDHTTWPSAISVVRLARLKIARELISRCDCRCAPDALASTASRPAFVTTRDPPLLSEQDSAG
jgi:hypothetical protein